MKSAAAGLQPASDSARCHHTGRCDEAKLKPCRCTFLTIVAMHTCATQSVREIKLLVGVGLEGIPIAYCSLHCSFIR